MREAIGTAEYVEVAKSLDLEGYYSLHSCKEDFTPDGWKFLGNGIDRAAFLAPDGYVYKVPRYRGDSSQNDHEAMFCAETHFRFEAGDPTVVDAFEYVYIPFASQWGRIVVAEYIDHDCDSVGDYNPEGEGDSYWSEAEIRAARSLGIGDCHDQNCFRMADGRVAIVDCGLAAWGGDSGDGSDPDHCDTCGASFI